jgi:hypothetical protein
MEVLIVLLMGAAGVIFFSRARSASRRRPSKSSDERAFYRRGYMREEVDALNRARETGEWPRTDKT